MDNTQIAHLIHIQEASRQNKLVVFVGAGVSANSGIPTWNELINSFKSELSDNQRNEKDDLKIAQLYKDSRGFKEYFEKIREVLKDGKASFNPIHTAILELSPSHIITTNYDDLIEQSIKSNFKQYDIITKDSDLPYSRYPNKVVKMHGDFKTGNIVLAENDYYNYETSFPLIRSFVTSLFATHVVLFVGFSFADLNLKIILNEIKNILDNNMQRVYLLTDESIDKDLTCYYERKGINVVSISNPDDYITNYKIWLNESDLNKLKSQKGKTLYKQLKTIESLDRTSSEDLLKLVSSKLKKIEPELNVIGDGLRYLFPKDSFTIWNRYSEGLQLFSPYFDKLEKDLKTSSGKRKFVKLFPKQERVFLFQQAFVNQIYTLENIPIITSNNYDKILKSFDEVFYVDYFYSLDFGQLFNSIKTLRTIGLSYTKRDLFLPYILCRLGKYHEAYQQYELLLQKFWEQERYVLYYICLYNLYNIRHKITSESWHRDDIDANRIIEEIEQYDLEAILIKLPIDKEIKQILKDILTYRFFSQKAIDADELSRKIHQQRKHADKGGVSMNSNIYALTAKFYQVFNFCVSNCIEFNNSYFFSLAKDTAIGILNSHKTIENHYNEILCATKLNLLEWQHVFVLLFYLKTNELKELFNQYDVQEIQLSEEAIHKFETIIDNLHSYIFPNNRFQNPSFDIEVLSDIIGNIVLLLGCSSKTISNEIAEKLYCVILGIWRFPLCNIVQESLYLLIKRLPPSNQTAIKLLENCISTNRDKSIKLAQVLNEQFLHNNIKFDSISDIKILFDQTDGRLGLALYPSLPTQLQNQFVEYNQKHNRILLMYLIIVHHTKSAISDIKHFEELLKQPNFTQGLEKEQILRVCWFLSFFRKQEQYSNVYNIIDGHGKSFAQYEFYLNPIKYQDTASIKAEWLLKLEDSEIKKLLKNKKIRSIVKDHLLSKENDMATIKRFITLL